MKLETLSHLFIFILFWNVTIHSNLMVILAIFPLLFYMRNPFPIQRNDVYFILLFLFLLAWMLLLNVMHENMNYEAVSQRYLKKMIFIFTLVLFIILFYSQRKELLLKSINAVLTILVGLWLMQFVVYYTTGEYIDLLKPITGVEQRYQMYFGSDGTGISGGPIRPTSVFNEPGTYSMAVLPLLILSYISKRRLTKLHLLTLFSFFASLSLFAIISATLFTFVVMLSKFNFKFTKKNVFFIFVFILIIILLVIGLDNYLTMRSRGSEGKIVGAAQRMYILDYWFSLDSFQILLGQGFGQTKFPNYVVNDSGLAFKLLYEYGIMSAPMFLFLFYISWGLPAFFLFIIFLTKTTYVTYLFWFYFAALYIIHKRTSTS